MSDFPQMLVGTVEAIKMEDLALPVTRFDAAAQPAC